MNISDVYVFNKIATTLSFTKAARQIGCSRFASSKKISRLEQNLGVILINRSIRSVSLTEYGRTFLQHTSEVNTMIKQAADVVRSADLKPTGTVAFNIPSSLGATLMPALITRFQTLWPDVKFSMRFEDHMVDLIAEGYDLAIRVSHKLMDSNLISRRLGSTHKVLATSRGYVERFGVPTNLQDLKNHRCLGFDRAVNGGTIWQFRGLETRIDIPCNFSFAANNAQALILAACLDNGIIYLPEVYISNELAQQRLEPILPDAYVPESYGIFAVYPHRNAAAKVKVLVNFIERELSSLRINDRGAPLTGSIGHHGQCANLN